MWSTFARRTCRITAIHQPSCVWHESKYSYKKGRSPFLSDGEGVASFVDLLNSKERKMLVEEIQKKERLLTPDENGPTSSPSWASLRHVFLYQALPFIGFGFLDNLIMILAGDYIDTTIGVTLGISTMAAAGLGNTISDVAGLGSAWYVERLFTKVGPEYPKLSEAQGKMKVTKLAIQLGRVVGVFIGCILGMSPLLFLPTKANKEKNN